MKKTLLVSAVFMALSGSATAADYTFATESELKKQLANVTSQDDVTIDYAANPINKYYSAALYDVELNVNNLYVKSNNKGLFPHNTGHHIVINAEGDVTIDSAYYAIQTVDDGNSAGQPKSATINAKGNVTINGTIMNTGSGEVTISAGETFALNAANGISNNGQGTTVDIQAKNIQVETEGSWTISSFGNVNLIAEESLALKNAKESDSSYVIRGRNGGTVNVEATNGDAVIEGTIRTDDTGEVNATLNTAGSYFTGKVVANGDGGTNLEMNNGATWNVTGDSDVASLTGNNAVINVPNDVAVTAKTAAATATINLATDAGTLTAGTFSVNNATGSDISVNLTGVTSDDLTQDQATALINNVSAEGADVSGYVQEGMYNGTITTENGNATSAVNSVMSNVLDLAANQSVAMNRILTNDVRKRLGDLRASEGTHGVWARYDGGKLSGSNEYENDFSTIQVGIDTVPVADAPRFGVAFAYTTSDADMKRGGADMDAFSLAFYGTKMYDNGMFVDVIGRMATADTDVVIDGDKKGSMDNVALSLSGELGWRFDVTEKFYFEPQAELTYTYVNADKLVLSSGHEYEFDSVDSLIGRVGFAAGFKCPDNFGDVYVRASAVHEFLGDATVRGGSNVHEVNGEDTWVEFGIGANFNINKNAYVYVDVERTEGAKLEEDWRANVGVRYAF